MSDHFINTAPERADAADSEARYLHDRFTRFAELVKLMRVAQEACCCNDPRFDERRQLEAQVDAQLEEL